MQRIYFRRFHGETLFDGVHGVGSFIATSDEPNRSFTETTDESWHQLIFASLKKNNTLQSTTKYKFAKPDITHILHEYKSFLQLIFTTMDHSFTQHDIKQQNTRARLMARHRKSPHFPPKASLKDGKTFHQDWCQIFRLTLWTRAAVLPAIETSIQPSGGFTGHYSNLHTPEWRVYRPLFKPP